ncbi:MAG: hypothetical protein KIS81_05400 [Maricaulaceae bacterium]|nr:hypothetical protein [Maricaulaceae bacterium]
MALFILRLVHTLIYAAAIAMLAGMAIYAFTGRLQGWLPLFIGFPVAIFIALVLNRGTCILQTWAKRLSGTGDGWARDIFFLPEPLALRTLPVCAPTFVIIALGVAARWWLTSPNAP